MAVEHIREAACMVSDIDKAAAHVSFLSGQGAARHVHAVVSGVACAAILVLIRRVPRVVPIGQLVDHIARVLVLVARDGGRARMVVHLLQVSVQVDRSRIVFDCGLEGW